MKRYVFVVILLMSTGLFAQKIQIDKRALNYYSKEEIQSMPESKIKKINYLYKYSFIIPDEFKGQIDPNSIDIRKYARYRKLNEMAKVYLIDDTKEPKAESDYNLSGKYIYLISIEDLRDAYDKIDAGLIDVK